MRVIFTFLGCLWQKVATKWNQRNRTSALNCLFLNNHRVIGGLYTSKTCQEGNSGCMIHNTAQDAQLLHDSFLDSTEDLEVLSHEKDCEAAGINCNNSEALEDYRSRKKHASTLQNALMQEDQKLSNLETQARDVKVSNNPFLLVGGRGTEDRMESATKGNPRCPIFVHGLHVWINFLVFVY